MTQVIRKAHTTPKALIMADTLKAHTTHRVHMTEVIRKGHTAAADTARVHTEEAMDARWNSGTEEATVMVVIPQEHQLHRCSENLPTFRKELQAPDTEALHEAQATCKPWQFSLFAEE